MAKRFFDIAWNLKRESPLERRESRSTRLGNNDSPSISLRPISITTASLNHHSHCDADSTAAIQPKRCHSALGSPVCGQSAKANHPSQSCQSFSTAVFHTTIDRLQDATSSLLINSSQPISEVCLANINTSDAVNQLLAEPMNIGDPYREPIVIAGTLKSPVYKCPHSEPETCESLRKMLPDLTDTLWSLIDDNPQLAGVSTQIEVQLLMCTSQPNLRRRAAYPAVIITCDKKLEESLKDLLNSKAMRKYNLLWPTRPKGQFDNYRCRIHIESIAGAPSLNLGDSFDLSTVQARFWQSEYNRTGVTYCGTSIVTNNDDKLATVACIVKSGPRFFRLTAAHAFRDLLASNVTTNCKDSQAIDQDTIGYGSSTSLYRKIQIIVPSMATNRATRDYDWALIPLSSVYPPKMNSFFSRQHGRVVLEKVVGCHPAVERKVSIISSRRFEIRGILLCGNTYRQLSPNAKVAELWSVQLIDGDLVKGDSGSLVVDTETREVYGYVISLSRDLKIHIVPLFRVMDQVQHVLNCGVVSLPSMTDILDLGSQASTTTTPTRLDERTTSLVDEKDDGETLTYKSFTNKRQRITVGFDPQANYDQGSDVGSRESANNAASNDEKNTCKVMDSSFQPSDNLDGTDTSQGGLNESRKTSESRRKEENKPLASRGNLAYDWRFAIAAGLAPFTIGAPAVLTAVAAQSYKSKSHRIWYCCECNEGPKSSSYEKKCTGCGHRVCCYCKIENL